MVNIILYAIPVFALLLILEFLSFRFLPEDDELGYDRSDRRSRPSRSPAEDDCSGSGRKR